MDSNALDVRLRKLERANRRLLVALILVVVGCVTILVATLPSTDEVRTSRFVLQDSHNHERMVFQITDKDSTSMTVFDNKKRRRMTLMAMADGASVLSFMKTSGEPTMNLRLDADGRSAVLLGEMGKKPGVMITADAFGDACVSVMGEDGEIKARFPKSSLLQQAAKPPLGPLR